jgi:antitoxin (DNA-binding transcriptional repressor) of toxin-antitoxin stability system
MPQYNIGEAKSRLSELLERALLGEEVILPKTTSLSLESRP